jgi:hypothetical protein
MWTAVIIIYGRVPSYVNRYYVCLICDMYTVFFCCFYYWIPFSWNGPCMPFKIRGQRVVQYISPAGSFVLWLFCSQCLRDMTNEQLEWLAQIFKASPGSCQWCPARPCSPMYENLIILTSSGFLLGTFPDQLLHGFLCFLIKKLL